MEALLLSLLFLVLSVIGIGIAFALGAALGLAYGRYYYDGTETSGARYWPAVQQVLTLVLGHPLRAYFSYTLRGAVAPDKPVIYACHPHGLFALSAALGFGLPLAPASPPVRCAVHRLVFAVPLLRDVALWLGCINVTREAMRHALLDAKQSVALVPGGVREMLPAGRRKVHTGFLKLAYETGTPVVPVYLQGEEDLFWTWDILPALREHFIRSIGYPFPSFFFGPLPRRLSTWVSAQAVDPSAFPGDYDAFETAYSDAQRSLIQSVVPRCEKD